MGVRSFALATASLLTVMPSAAGQDMEFVDVTAGSGLDFSLAPNAPGVAVGDYDRDGWPDVCITGIGPRRGPRMYRNLGGVRGPNGPWFADVTHTVMPDDVEPASVSIFGDLDNDGDLDLVSSRRFTSPSRPLGNPREVGIMYYENVGGRYVKGTSDPSLGWDPDSSHGGLTLGDVDVDGDLDIVFVHNGGGNGIGGPGFYIRNDGIPNLVDATASFGANLDQVTRYFSVVLADFNGDLALDVHAAVDFFMDYHARNDGNGNFSFATQAANTTNLGADMGLAIGDMDNDGDLDIYSTNIGVGVLYVNDGNGNVRGRGQRPARARTGTRAFNADRRLGHPASIGRGPRPRPGPGLRGVSAPRACTGEAYLNFGDGFFGNFTNATAGLPASS